MRWEERIVGKFSEADLLSLLLRLLGSSLQQRLTVQGLSWRKQAWTSPRGLSVFWFTDCTHVGEESHDMPTDLKPSALCITWVPYTKRRHFLHKRQFSLAVFFTCFLQARCLHEYFTDICFEFWQASLNTRAMFWQSSILYKQAIGSFWQLVGIKLLWVENDKTIELGQALPSPPPPQSPLPQPLESLLRWLGKWSES